MWKKGVLAVAALAVLSAASSASADVQMSLKDGHVTIVARDATVRQILMEWARIGQTTIVNVERIPGTPLTIELRDVPEEQALKILLRSISGYVTAPRATMGAADASVFDRIIVMPTVAAAAAPLSAAPPPPAFATFQRPQELPAPDSDDERPNPSAPIPPPGNRGPVFFSFPPPQATATQPPPGGRANTPQAESAPFVLTQQPGAVPVTPPAISYPGAPTTLAPVGVATPGMVAPAPAPQPGQQPLPQP